MTRSCPEERAKRKPREESTTLETLIYGAKVKSLANGNLLVVPDWKGVKPYTKEDGGGPGLFTRLAGAAALRVLIDRHLKVKRG